MLDFIVRESKLKVQAVWTNSPKPFGRGQVLRKTPVSLLAKKHGIKCYECEKITQEEEKALMALEPEFIFIVAFGKILPSSFFNLPLLGSYNLHFSLLPKYRGASPLQSAILNGEAKTGITYQKINHLMDRGAIVLQREFELAKASFPEALNQALAISKSSFNEFLSQIKQAKGKESHFLTQNEEAASYCRKITKQAGEMKKNLTTSLTTEGFIHKFLAFKSWPGIYFHHQKQRFNIVEIDLTPKTEGVPFNKTSFMTLNRVQKRLYLGLLDGWVEILTIQKQGGKKMLARDFLNGSRLDFPLTLD